MGFSPTTPHALAGQTIEPSVSVPTASGASPAATATADPELDPDGLRPAPCGLTAWPPRVLQPLLDRVDRKLAHSDRLALPRITAPGRAQPADQERVPGLGAEPARASPPCAGSPATAMLSLISTGMPCQRAGRAGPRPAAVAGRPPRPLPPG